MTANEEYFDRLVSHQLGLERLKTGVANNLLELLVASETDLKQLIAGRIALIDQRGPTFSANSTRRLNALLKDIEILRRKIYGDLETSLDLQRVDFGEYEAEFNARIIEDVVPIEDFTVTLPGRDQIVSAAQANPIRGRFLNEWFDQARTSELGRLNQILKVGFFEGRTNDQITSDIFGSADVPGDIRKSRANVKTIVRTSMQSMAQGARDELFNANQDLIGAVRYTSTLDGRTSAICRARDGREFPLGEPRPEIPAHPNCRSTYVPILDGVAIVGTRPFVRDTRARQTREINFRADARARAGDSRWKQLDEKQRRGLIQGERVRWADSAIGATPAETTYSQWFKKQPTSFQRQTLGPTKFDLYNQGGLDLNAFVDETSGKPWTLAQLQAREATAFAKIS